MSTKFECERQGQTRSFDTFEECEEFVLDRGDRNELWGYLGAAQAQYELNIERAYERQMVGDRDFTPPYEP